jgi:hypothetical protein
MEFSVVSSLYNGESHLTCKTINPYSEEIEGYG